jgi:hypothetical protein
LFSYRGEDVVQTLERVCCEVGYPKTIRIDNGGEFISRDLDLWAYQKDVILDFSRPRKPTDNAYLVPDDYDPAIIWAGLGLIPYSIVPHFRSLHPEADSSELAAQYLADNQLNFMTMQDGDAIIYENNISRYVSANDIA